MLAIVPKKMMLTTTILGAIARLMEEEIRFLHPLLLAVAAAAAAAAAAPPPGRGTSPSPLCVHEPARVQQGRELTDLQSLLALLLLLLGCRCVREEESVVVLMTGWVVDRHGTAAVEEKKVKVPSSEYNFLFQHIFTSIRSTKHYYIYLQPRTD